MIRSMLVIKVADDPVTVVDEPRAIIFDVISQADVEDRGSLKNIDTFEGSDGNAWNSFELEMSLEIVSIEFERKGDVVTIVINRANTPPEVVIFESSILEVWFPSPDSGSHALEVICLKSIAHGSRFVAAVLQKKNFYCDIEVTRVS